MTKPGKASDDDWASHLAQYAELDRRLRAHPWFLADGWETQFRFIGREDSPRVIFLLFKVRWGTDIHFKTRLTNADLQKRTARVGLHIETNVADHGFSRTAFNQLFQERAAAIVDCWPDYTPKPTHDQKPLHTFVPFTDETLVDVLEAEFVRIQPLGPVIDGVLDSLGFAVT